MPGGLFTSIIHPDVGRKRVLSTPLEPPVIIASFPSSGRIVVAPLRFIDDARW